MLLQRVSIDPDLIYLSVGCHKRVLGGFRLERLTVGLNISDSKLQSTARLACQGDRWQKRILRALNVSVLE